MALRIRRGTNLSHWLSQSPRRGADRRNFLTRADLDRIADWGLDHVRLPVDEEQLWDSGNRQEPEAWDLMDWCLDACEKAGLRVIVDLHILRCHYFNAVEQPPLFTDPAAVERFCRCWEELSERLSGRSNEQVAYEPLNEPVARDPQDWNRVLKTVYGTLRGREPARTIVWGSNWFNSVEQFDRLTLPAGDPNLLLTFHFYHPMLITHYRASWWRDGAAYAGPVRYPGRPIAEADFAALEPDLKLKLERWNGHFDRSTLGSLLEKPLAASKSSGLPLHCGEFGCLDTVSPETRAAWYGDVRGVFDEHGIAWSNWDYRGRFGLVDDRGERTAVGDALMI